MVFSGANQVPPVGYYYSSDQGMVKDSFNSRFRKKNQNHKKKNQLFSKNQTQLKTEPNTSQLYLWSCLTET